MSQPVTPDSLGMAPSRPSSVVKDYIAITKPKHQFVLLTCWATMALAGSPSATLVLITLFATSLAVASSHVFNQLLDRDIDAIMTRTRNRPIAAGRITPVSAAVYGSVLFALSLIILVWKVNLLTAWLAVAGMVFYIPVYTYWLKRSSPWCTLIGGVSGAMPTLIGWAAVTGEIGVPAFLLFTFMFIWQCPHFYALSLFRGEDYREANLPVLVVAEGVEQTQKHIVWYSVLMVLTTAMIYFVGAAGPVYLTLTLLGGGAYIAAGIVAQRQGKEEAPKWGKRLFFSSYLYLALIFITVVADRA